MYSAILRLPLWSPWEWRLCLFGPSSPAPALPLPSAPMRTNLMLAINGADNPQEQLAALDKFAQGARRLQVHALRERILRDRQLEVEGLRQIHRIRRKRTWRRITRT